MSPRATSRTYPGCVRPDESRIKRALAAAQPFLVIDLAARLVPPVNALNHSLVRFDTSKVGKPYTISQRQQSLRRAIDAFADLRDALVALDYPTQRKITGLHERLSERAQHGLAEFDTRLNYGDFTQRYWREFPAWIEGLSILLAEPFNAPEAPNEQTPRDRLVRDLREFFAIHGRKRLGVNASEQERRFINAVLREMGAKPVSDPARRARELTRKSAQKAKATKQVPK